MNYDSWKLQTPPEYECDGTGDCNDSPCPHEQEEDRMDKAPTGFTRAACSELQPGDVVRFPDTMIALEEERAGTFQVVRAWRWDATSTQLRLREVHSGRELAEAVGNTVMFWRRT